MIKTSELKPNYTMFGNKGSVWSNKAHITRSGLSITLCGVPMLSRNWARIENVEEIGCEECIKKYLELQQLIEYLQNKLNEEENK